MNQCERLKAEYEDIKTLKTEFDLAFEQAVKTGQIDKAKEIRAEIEQRMDALREQLWPFEQLPQEKLKKQYELQREILQELGILEKLSSGELGISRGNSADGEEYVFPEFQEASKRMRQSKSKELLIKELECVEEPLVLFELMAIKLDVLIEKYKQVILDHYQAGKLFATKKEPTDPDEPLELDKNQPVWVSDEYNNADTEGKLVYYLEEFSDNHQGKTKQEILNQTKQGFNMFLMEDLPNIPRQGKGKKIGGRKQLEAGASPEEYLEEIKKQSRQGMIPEGQIIYALIKLKQANQVIDDYQGNGSVSCQLGAFFTTSGCVPSAYWRRDDRRAGLSRDFPRDRGGDYFGARAGVRV